MTVCNFRNGSTGQADRRSGAFEQGCNHVDNVRQGILFDSLTISRSAGLDCRKVHLRFPILRGRTITCGGRMIFLIEFLSQHQPPVFGCKWSRCSASWLYAIPSSLNSGLSSKPLRNWQFLLARLRFGSEMICAKFSLQFQIWYCDIAS